LGLFATSLALLISDIPWNGPVAPIRIGEKTTIFPKKEEREKFDLFFSSLKMNLKHSLG